MLKVNSLYILIIHKHYLKMNVKIYLSNRYWLGLFQQKVGFLSHSEIKLILHLKFPNLRFPNCKNFNSVALTFKGRNLIKGMILFNNYNSKNKKPEIIGRVLALQTGL